MLKTSILVAGTIAFGCSLFAPNPAWAVEGIPEKKSEGVKAVKQKKPAPTNSASSPKSEDELWREQLDRLIAATQKKTERQQRQLEEDRRREAKRQEDEEAYRHAAARNENKVRFAPCDATLPVGTPCTRPGQ